MEIEYIMALIALAGVAVAWNSVRMAKAQIAASIDIAEKQIAASAEIAERQITAELVSANRQKWIEELRSHVADYISEAIACSMPLPDGTYDLNRFTGLNRLSNLIKLFLDPNEDPHVGVTTAISEFETYYFKYCTKAMAESSFGNEQLAEFASKASAVFTIAHELIAAECERVKRCE